MTKEDRNALLHAYFIFGFLLMFLLWNWYVNHKLIGGWP